MSHAERTLTRRRLIQGAAAGAVAGSLPLANARATRRRSAAAKPTVAVLGGGVAGLTAAHELAERGFRVTVYERKALGGKARSIPVPGTGTGGRADLPAEHGFRAVFGFYRNLPELMRRIPFAGNADGVYGNLDGVSHAQLARAGGADLTAPIALDAPAHTTPLQVWESLLASLRTLREIPPDQLAYFARQVAIFFTSCDARRFGKWEYASWWDFIGAERMTAEYRKQLADGLTRNLAAAKPKDMSVNSTGVVGESFAYALMYRPEGPSDRALIAPTNEAWIDPWITYLQGLGVEFRVGAEVEKLQLQGGRITGALVGGREIAADWFVSAVPVERARKLFAGPIVAADPRLERLDRIRTEWMNGVVFHLDREVPICDGHISYVDSPWALTSISQAQHWHRDIASQYGDGRARESFSTIISDFTAPGMVYGKPAWSLRPDQIAREVWEQLKAHLNDTGRTVLGDDMIVSTFVDPAIGYPATPPGGDRIASNDEPLLINTPGSWDDRPAATTAIPNLILAGDYVRCTMNVATMESACETGRRAARALVESSGARVEPVRPLDRWVPPENEPLKRLDERRYRLGQKHILDTPWPGAGPGGRGAIDLAGLLGRR